MKKLLIVDDQILYLISLDVSLKNIYEVETAETFGDAMKILEEQAIDIALLDIRLDENNEHNIDGLKLLEWIKKNKSQISVFMMSAYREFSYAEKALNLGAKYFFKKPIDIAELIRVLGQKG